ncbi:MAG: hydrogenase iron-sulfur subunit [Candidatus Nealsonbacteria bacterium]|nr:hydrogenase iron-sulfur subunit [Candidatus Nealsonbacteria bacterium]
MTAALPPVGFEKSLVGSDEVVVFRAASWTGQDAAARIGTLCRDESLDRVVICGPSPGTGLVPDWIRRDDGQPWIPVAWAGVREHCVWVEKDEEARAAKTRRLLEMAVTRARGIEPCTVANVAAKRAVAVVGSNHGAFWTASVLLDAGFPVILLQTERPEGCFYPIGGELVDHVTSHHDVRVVADASIEYVQGHVGDFRLRVGTPDGRVFFEVGAIVLAIDAHTGPLELDDTLDASGHVLGLREYGELVTGGEMDGKDACIWVDRNALDRRCAGQAALTFALEHVRRGGKSRVLFRQVPVYGRSGQRLYDDARAAGVTVIRYNTAPRFDVANGAVRVAVADIALPGETLEFAVDRLVIPAPIRPSSSHARLAALLRQPLDLQGYLQPGNVRHRPVGCARRGVYFVGGCHDECDPGEAGLEAWAVLADLMALLPEGTVEVPVEKVAIDTDKCAACLTCYRACPHGAIQPHPSQHQMDVLAPACWQCGICVSVCPARALEPGNLRSNQVHDMLQVATRELLGRRPIIAFACRQSAVPAADAMGQSGLLLPADVLLVDVPCAGLIADQIVLDTLEQGARGVLVLGCHHDNCRSLWGSDLSRKRIDKVRKALGAIDVEEERVRFHTIAANEPHRLAHLLAEASQSMPSGRIGD